VLGHFPSPSGPTGDHQLGRGCLGYVGAVLQQWQGSAWAPLDFFSKKLEAAQQKIRNFRSMLHGTEFCILSDHKLLFQSLGLPGSRGS
jgi:hypothetical protein